MRKELVFSMVVLALVAVLLVVPTTCYAVNASVVLQDDKATIDVDVFVNITDVPISEIQCYKDFWVTMWSTPATRTGILEALKQMIVDYLRHELGYTRADVESLSMNYEFVNASPQYYIIVNITMTITGISNATWYGYVYNCKFRKMCLDHNGTWGNFVFNPARLFFFTLAAFDKPLEEWERTYNGTHTIFKCEVPVYTYYTVNGYVVTVDPEETIVVPGDAQAQGDTIIVYQASPQTFLLGLAVAIIAVVVIIVALKAFKHSVYEYVERTRKFVKRKK